MQCSILPRLRYPTGTQAVRLTLSSPQVRCIVELKLRVTAPEPEPEPEREPEPKAEKRAHSEDTEGWGDPMDRTAFPRDHSYM